MMAKIKEVVGKMLGNLEDTSQAYKTALNENNEKLDKLESELIEESEKLKDMHKMYVLKQLDNKQYMNQRDAVEKINSEIEELKYENKMIKDYRSADYKVLIAEIDTKRTELNQQQQKEIAEIKADMYNAKMEYLAKMEEYGQRYGQAVREDSLIQSWLLKLGKQKNIYIPMRNEILHGIGTVSQQEINQRLG